MSSKSFGKYFILRSMPSVRYTARVIKMKLGQAGAIYAYIEGKLVSARTRTLLNT